MAKAKLSIIDKNIDRFIDNNFDKKIKQKDDTKKFEFFVNSMHIWNYSSQTFNINSKIGIDISLGDAQGTDAFFISINNFEKIYNLNDDIEKIIEYLKNDYNKSKSTYIVFHFIQTKKTEHIRWPDFLNLIDVPLKIWRGLEFNQSQKILKQIQNFIDLIVDDDDNILKNISHKIEISFYTNQDEVQLEKLKKVWETDIETKIKELKGIFGGDEQNKRVEIYLRGSDFLNNIYEKLNSNTYVLNISKTEVIEAEEDKYLIGYLTAKELLASIAPEINGNRTLYRDVFKNNIRLYLGGTDVNIAIEKTLKEEPEKFHFYNNGLTITTKKIDSNSKNFAISPVNIVNGCQTANSIYNFFKSNTDNIDDVKIPVKVVVANDTDFENITIRTNTQNGIEAKDLISIRNFQRDLEEKFSKTTFLNKKFFYKRQKSDSNEINDADYIIQIDDILRASLSTIMLIPNKVSGYYDHTTKKYLDKIFDERFSSLYVIITVLLKLISEEIDNVYPKFNRLKYHICYLFYKFVNKDIDVKIFENYFKNKEDFEIDENTNIEEKSEIEENLNNIDNFIKKAHSNIYTTFKKSEYFTDIVRYIVDTISSDYPMLLDFSDKKKERVLYISVEKFKGARNTPLFENFTSIFIEDFKNIISKRDATNSTTIDTN